MKLKKPILISLILIIVFQGLRELAVRLIFPLLPETVFSLKMLTMGIMIFLCVLVFAFAKIRKVRIPFFPEKFTLPYKIASAVCLILYIATPSNYTVGFSAVMVLVYSSIITPVYEEVLFRGVIWEYFERETENIDTVYIWNIILFTVWHAGYMISNMIDGDWTAVALKLCAGVGYGIVLGFVRTKSENVYATVLLHGMINLFMV